MRMARFLIAYGVVSVLGVLASLFLAQNTQAERLTFFGQEVSTSLAWIIIGATAAGFSLALLLLVPGRIAATLHIWSLRREARALDEELVWQSEQHDQLLEHHERLLTGHEWLLSAYRRTQKELDLAIGERDSLQVQLAGANDALNDALAAQRKIATRREIIIPAPVRQTSDSTPTAPRIPVVKRAPVTVAVENTEDAKEQVALPAQMRTPAPAASTMVDRIEQAQAAVTPGEAADDESRLAHSSKPSAALFGEAPVSRKRSVTSRLDDWRREVWSSARGLYARGTGRIDHAITQTRHFGAALLDRLKERWNSLSARTPADRRVSPMTQPK
jgi:uncharacterized integral membrane protein